MCITNIHCSVHTTWQFTWCVRIDVIPASPPTSAQGHEVHSFTNTPSCVIFLSYIILFLYCSNPSFVRTVHEHVGHCFIQYVCIIIMEKLPVLLWHVSYDQTLHGSCCMLMFEHVLHFKANAVLLQLFFIPSPAHMHALDDRELSYFKDQGESCYVILLLYFILYFIN